MDKISGFLSGNPKYQRLSGPLRAAQVCDAARVLANDRFGVLSFHDGLLTLTVESSAAGANLQFEMADIINQINEKIGRDLVKKIRFNVIS